MLPYSTQTFFIHSVPFASQIYLILFSPSIVFTMNWIPFIQLLNAIWCLSFVFIDLFFSRFCFLKDYYDYTTNDIEKNKSQIRTIIQFLLSSVDFVFSSFSFSSFSSKTKKSDGFLFTVSTLYEW